MGHLLGAEKISLSYPARTIFDEVTLGINDGDRIGVVGRNGDGKSTLLTILSGVLDPDSGKVTARNGLRVGMLGQSESIDPTLSVKDAIVGDSSEYEWASKGGVREILSGLIPPSRWDQKVGDLSGGESRRVALAALLVGEWDVLFLDEPTNHLDLESVTWLADHIKNRWPRNVGGFVIVTHDRWLLDEVCLTTWEVHDSIVEPFDGGYASYVLARVERDRQASVIENKRQNLMRKELAWLRRGAPARTSKPKFRIEAANVLIAQEPPVRNSVELSAMAVSRLGREVIELDDVSFSYGQRKIIDQLTWKVGPGDRIGILGSNGVGKSTLLSILTGDLKPTSGDVKMGSTVRIGRLDQKILQSDQVKGKRLHEVVARYKTTDNSGGRELSVSQLLERIGFDSYSMATFVDDFSGGQRRRLQLLLTLLGEPNVLVLDEPTNDMDVDMLAAIEDLLDTWPGTLFVVSHDRYLIERVTDMQYGLINGQFVHLVRGVDQFLELLGDRNSDIGTIDEQSTKPKNNDLREDRKAKKEAAREISNLEKKMKRLSQEIKVLVDKMAAHDFGDYRGLAELDAKMKAASAQLGEAEEAWLNLSMLDEDA
ncbi:ABC-F family ATP-binding cassette domain-containing protein [Acidithrix ferrooxidans]|uniref:Putative ABC transporter ATP-binding protein n=1 Tax=Acidithrix ferrooxidans TaxID=1280514 RepID=A0A0D8HFG6_9ACTN|nr:ABC-F family ATP-binding cassette domain-containing protein [Acidithrix ferrooxidans]KJF15801.1 putative ABC transporter ATP-binding protein [Acidithrix ferrooxidans]